ncbi:MAG TPA: DedA family protein [Desertimonas sp.]|nr:DedA family protein [Desertimonas sp.]
MGSVLLGNIFSDLVGWFGDTITALTDWLDDIAGEWWFLLVILAIAFFDSVIPLVPSETAVIIGGVAAGQGDQVLPLVILCGAAGAFLGDNFAYLIGRRFSPAINRRAERRPKTAQRLEWASTQIRARGGPLLTTARFIPGGRTALTVTSGLTRQSHPWFARWIALAALIWATYAAGLGYIFGKRFQDNHTVAFLLAFGAALSITVIIEVVRHVRTGEGTAEVATEEFALESKDVVAEAVDGALQDAGDQPAGTTPADEPASNTAAE